MGHTHQNSLNCALRSLHFIKSYISFRKSGKKGEKERGKGGSKNSVLP